MDQRGTDRRKLLGGVAVGAAVWAARTGAARAAEERGGDIPPTEDLMREHGVLRRILIVYGEAARRLAADDAVALAAVAGAASVVRRFVEGYHEKLEEQFVLPKLERAGKLVELARTIRAQHVAGRRLTDAILAGAKAKDRKAVLPPLQSFARMYAAHAAWEDTELFPFYRGMFSEPELDKLGEQFEEQEHKLLGRGGFAGSLQDVGDLEKTLGIHDLAKFTPT